jgi:hypothetical protein
MAWGTAKYDDALASNCNGFTTVHFKVDSVLQTLKEGTKKHTYIYIYIYIYREHADIISLFSFSTKESSFKIRVLHPLGRYLGTPHNKPGRKWRCNALRTSL